MNTKDLAQALRQASRFCLDAYQDILLESADKLEEQERELNRLKENNQDRQER